MDLGLILYTTTVFCSLVVYVFNNYLVKRKNLDYQWHMTADLVWIFSLLPGVNAVVLLFVSFVIIYNLTKNFIEQN